MGLALLAFGLATVVMAGQMTRAPLSRATSHFASVPDLHVDSSAVEASQLAEAPSSPTKKGLLRRRPARTPVAYSASLPVAFVRESGISHRGVYPAVLSSRLLEAIGLPGVWLTALLSLVATIGYRMRQQGQGGVDAQPTAFRTIALAAEGPRDSKERPPLTRATPSLLRPAAAGRPEVATFAMG
eukprot:EG_transcript_18211